MIRSILAVRPDPARPRHVVDTLDDVLPEGCVRAAGTALFEAGGRRIEDFSAGWGTLLLGHHPPDVRATVEEVVRADVPPGGEAALAEAVAARLVRLAPDLAAVSLHASISEAIDAALRLARRATRRPRFVAAGASHHGVTLGALSVSARDHRRASVEPLLDGALIPWGDLATLERLLRHHDVAAFVLEPIQVEGGVRTPPPGYLATCAAMCRRHGTLLIVDEAQTGLGRTGAAFACESDRTEPDVIVVGEALSAGTAPVAALLARRKLWERAYGPAGSGAPDLRRAPPSLMALAAALATLEVIERDHLITRAATVGEAFGIQLRLAATESPLCRTVRGRGLLWGIELKAQAATRALTLGAVDRLAERVVPERIAFALREHGYHITPARLAPEVLRFSPPLTVDEAAAAGCALAVTDALAHNARGVLSATVGSLTDRIRWPFGKKQ